MPDLHTLTKNTASRRPSSNPAAFLAAYAWWTAKITSPVCAEGEPLPPDDINIAAQIEAYAATRRRDARTHRMRCHCDACNIRRDETARYEVAALPRAA